MVPYLLPVGGRRRPGFCQPDNIAFRPTSRNVFEIEDNPNGGIFACLPDGGDRDIKSNGCVKVVPVKDSSAEPTGFFSPDGKTAYLSIMHSDDNNMSMTDDFGTDDLIKVAGFKAPKALDIDDDFRSKGRVG